jgi:uncharacterized protein
MSNREVAEHNEVIRIVNGSKLYGTDVDTSDDDFMAVFIEPVQSVYVGGSKMESVQLRDKPEGVRSEAGDVDCTSYSLRHFAKLAAAGNPSVLTLLSAPDSAVVNETDIGRALRDPAMQQKFASRQAVPRFKGYMMRQKERMLGERGGHMPKRPELVEKYGFDTKYANHVLRLGIQGCEFLRFGYMTLPMNDDDVNMLLRVRGGEYSFEKTLELIEAVERDLELAAERSLLPEQPDFPAIAAFLREAHEEFWAGNL